MTPLEEGYSIRWQVAHQPNHGLQVTAKSRRSCVAAAIGGA